MKGLIAGAVAGGAVVLVPTLLVASTFNRGPSQQEQDAALVAAVAAAQANPAQTAAPAALDASLEGCVLPGAVLGGGVKLTAEQQTVARAAINAAKIELGPEDATRGAVVQVAAGLVESELRNLDHGHADSLGPWQMRPSQGWGTPAQIMDLGYSSRKFAQVLKTVPGWQGMDIGKAAQAVERSAYPSKYALRVGEAQQIVATLSGNTSGCAQAPVSAFATGPAKTVLAWAFTQSGSDYVFGGNGRLPAKGGWDCSSFSGYAYGLVGLKLPRTAEAQRDWFAAGGGTLIPYGQEKPGDALFWDSYLGPKRIGHVLIVADPVKKTTIEAQSTKTGIGSWSYARCPQKSICQIYRPKGW